MSTPPYSIVVPAFNVESTVRAAVESALRQSYGDLEVIVVDDGSTDRTAELVEALTDPRVRLVRQANRGLSGARNAGVRHARGDLVAFLDADDLLMPDYLGRMAAALEQDPPADVAFCDAWVFETGTGRVRRTTVFDRHRPPGPLPRDPADLLLVHLRRNFFHAATVVRRQALESTGGFREDLTSLEDYELWLRLEASGHRAVEVAEPLALVRRSPTQMSADTARMARNLVRVCDLMAAREDLPRGAGPIIEERRRQALAVLRALERPWSPPGMRRWLRGGLTAAAHRLPRWRVWREHPPDGVRTAFGDLSRV
jgi:glycosyltransferase involved in cell wall biosynthesis